MSASSNVLGNLRSRPRYRMRRLEAPWNRVPVRVDQAAMTARLNVNEREVHWPHAGLRPGTGRTPCPSASGSDFFDLWVYRRTDYGERSTFSSMLRRRRRTGSLAAGGSGRSRRTRWAKAKTCGTRAGGSSRPRAWSPGAYGPRTTSTRSSTAATTRCAPSPCLSPRRTRVRARFSPGNIPTSHGAA